MLNRESQMVMNHLVIMVRSFDPTGIEPGARVLILCHHRVFDSCIYCTALSFSTNVCCLNETAMIMLNRESKMVMNHQVIMVRSFDPTGIEPAARFLILCHHRSFIPTSMVMHFPFPQMCVA